MSEEEKPPKPNLKIVKKWQQPPGIDRDAYDRLTEIYLHGTRSIRGLATKGGVAYQTARKAIEVGWPAQGWDALAERARLYDKLHAEGQTATSPERAKSARDWIKMRDDYIEIAAGVRVGLAKSLRILVQNVDLAVATKMAPQRQVHFEEVLDDKGAIVRRIPHTLTVDVMLPPSIHAIADSFSQIASALDRTGGGELEQLMANPPPGATGKRGHRLTAEQIRYMAENQGKIPPGVTMEDLGG